MSFSGKKEIVQFGVGIHVEQRGLEATNGSVNIILFQDRSWTILTTIWVRDLKGGARRYRSYKTAARDSFFPLIL